MLLHLKLSDSATSLHIPQSSITDVCNFFRLNLQKSVLEAFGMCYFIIQKCDGVHTVYAINVEQSFRTPSNPPCCASVCPRRRLTSLPKSLSIKNKSNHICIGACYNSNIFKDLSVVEQTSSFNLNVVFY